MVKVVSLCVLVNLCEMQQDAWPEALISEYSNNENKNFNNFAVGLKFRKYSKQLTAYFATNWNNMIIVTYKTKYIAHDYHILSECAKLIILIVKMCNVFWLDTMLDGIELLLAAANVLLVP